MNLFGYELKFGRAKRRSVSDAPVAAWLAGEEYGGRGMTNAYAQVVWVYRAVNALAESVANIPFRFTSATGKERTTSPALEAFYARPHPMLNGFQYWELRVIWLMLRGECFRIPVFREERGRPVLDRVLIPDPVRFTHIVEDGELVGWRYQAYGRGDAMKSQAFLPEEVWHERLSNPFDHWRGMSPLSVAETAAASDFASGQFMKALMQNNGDAGIIVRTQDQLDAEQREQLLAALRERKRGSGVADRPLLLWGGAEVEMPKAASADLQLLGHRKFTLAEICAAFGVPEEILTSLNSAKYDVMKGARLNFIENRVVPLCRRLEGEEQRVVKLIDPKARGFFVVDEHPVLSAARRERLSAAEAGFKMGVPLNELNRALELGFKVFPWGDVGYVPGSMVAAGSGEGVRDKSEV